ATIIPSSSGEILVGSRKKYIRKPVKITKNTNGINTNKDFGIKNMGIIASVAEISNRASDLFANNIRYVLLYYFLLEEILYNLNVVFRF
ncbi:MAG: hypothetical protein ACTSPM_09950, partial [Candidatus Heimdallarchaeota archaeon]